MHGQNYLNWELVVQYQNSKETFKITNKGIYFILEKKKKKFAKGLQR